MIVTVSFGSTPIFLQEGNNPTLHVDFDDCVSWFNGYNEDYSEFTALSSPVENCGELEMAGPGYVYRNNSKENVHSCTPGIDSTSLGMCITAFDNCSYVAGESTSLVFEVRVIPGASGMGSMEEISFYEKAPEIFNYYQGESGTNNYPTKFGIRVLIDTLEIFREENIDTEREWNLRTFNFSDVEAFTVTSTTIFKVEILPYCLIGNDAPVNAWDIDNLTITAGCNSVNAGFVKVIGNVNICQGDSLDHTLTFEAENAFGPNLTWMVLDQQGEIILIPNGNMVDFETLDNGLYAIYHLAFGDDLDGLALGNTLEDIEGCFDLSSRIVIVNNRLEGGFFETINNETSIQICSEGAAENIVELMLEGQVGLQTNYFLLSDSMEILEVSLDPFFDLINTDAGNYSIVAVTHNGQLINAIPGNTLSQVRGCFAVSNSVNISKEFISGGTVTLNTRLFCLSDSIPDILDASVSNATGFFQQFIITNEDSIIIGLPTLPIDLDGVIAGECIMWHLSSIEEISLQIDSRIDQISGECFDISDPVAFSRQDNDAGLLTIGGSTSVDVCIADGFADIAIVDVNQSSGTNYTFVITDSVNVVISSTDINLIDFSNAPVGICRVWGVAHDGSFSIEEGDELSNTLITECTSISSSFVQVNRVDDGPACGIFPCEVSGGMIDLDRNNFCVGDGEPDIISGEIQEASGDFMQIVVTGSDSIIVALLDSLSFDLDTLGQGTCFFWNIASTDTIALSIGDNINNLNNTCFDISSGAPVARIQNNGGQLSLVNGLTEINICVADSLSDILNVITSGEGQSYEYIITDESNVIISVQDSTSVDFSNAPVGVCRIWGLAHNSVYDQMPGDTVEIFPSVGRCFDLSENFITVNRFDSGIACGEISCEVDGGFIDLFGSTYCVNDGVSDLVTGDVQNAMGAVQQIIVTGSDSIIIDLPDALNFDIDNAPAGICIVWNLASNDSIPLMMGMNINTIQNECFDLSPGASFTRIANNAGTVTLTNGMTLDTICAGDNIQNALAFTTVNTVSDSFQYVITNETNTILALPTNNSFNFDVLPFGICRVYGVAYSGAFLPEVGDSLMIDPATNGCFDISDNFVAIVKEDCSMPMLEAGTISLSNGSVEFCPGDTTGVLTDLAFTFEVFNAENPQYYYQTDLDGDADVDFIFASDSIRHVEFEGTNINITTLNVDSIGFLYYSEIVDIDGDNDMDIISSETGAPFNSYIYFNDGSNNFTRTLLDDTWLLRKENIISYDVDGDNDLDILMSGREIFGNSAEFDLRVFINDGSLNFTAESLITTSAPNDFKIEDFNADGNVDLVLETQISDSLILYLDIFGTKTKVVIDEDMNGVPFDNPRESRIQSFDFDNDGDFDIVASGTEQDVILYSNEAGTFTKFNLITYPEINTSNRAGLGDLNGDGYTDIITGNRTHLNNGDNTFELLVTDINRWPLIIDVDNDGQMNIMSSAVWYDFESSGYSFNVTLTGASAGTTRWLLTDDQGDIASIDDQDPPLTYDLLPLGTYNLYHIVYNETTVGGLTLGENISNLSGDFELSNIITLNSTPCEEEECIVDGGFIDLFGSQFCVGDGEADFVTGDVQNAVGDVQQIVVTDSDSLIIAVHDTLNFDVDGAFAGTCIVWNLASNDTIPLTNGMHINTINSSCFDLSTGATFTRIFNNGGVVSIDGGGTTIEVCVSDGTADEITFTTTGDGASYQFIVTDESNVIVALPDSTVVDFEGTPAGECRIWGLATNSVFDGVVGDTLTEPEVPGRCYDLSSNFVTVQRFDTGGPCGTSGNNPLLTIVLTRVGESSNIFDIKNISNDTIDVSDYWICRTNNIYDRIGATNIECGSFNTLMAPGDVNGLNLSLDNSDGELAIYNDFDFDNPDAMIHYVEWGSTGHGRSDEAVAANLWSTGDFVDAITPNNSIYFTGQGYTSDSWNEGLTNTCGDIIISADIVFSRVGDTGDVIDLENIGSQTIDINDYEIRQGNNAYRLGDLDVDCGNATRILAAGEKVGLVVPTISNVGSELALYTSSANASFGPVSDYVQWGDAGFPNESRAVFSGIWVSGTFVPSFASGQSIYYVGTGDAVSDWAEGATSNCGTLEANKKRIEMRISPNPAIDMVSIKIMDTQRPVTNMQVVDGNGKVLISADMEMNNNDIYQMGINDLSPGIYFLRMKSSNAVVTERFMVIK